MYGKKYVSCIAAILLLLATACQNNNLLDKLESPGGSGNSSAGPFGPIFVFRSNNALNGNVKGVFATARAGADAECQTTRSSLIFPNNSCGQVRAFISLSSSDSIANMPGNYGIATNRAIHASNNFTIAADFNAFRDGAGSTLAPNVMTAGSSWRSFSLAGGCS